MGLVTKIYDRSPIWVQNLMISAKGRQLKASRYGREYKSYLQFLLESDQYSRDQLDVYQSEALKRFIMHAGTTVPYYREAWKGIDLRGISGAIDLGALPILTKQELRQNLPSLRSENIDQRGLVWASTSGTTGTPLKIPFTTRDMQRRMALLDRMLLRAGFVRGQRSARFSGRTLYPRAEKTGIFWRLNRPMNQMFFSTYHMTPENMERYVRQLQVYNPVLIDGYPSAISILARHIIDRDLVGTVTPQVVSVTAETLHDYQRELIERAFGCKVYNQYASSEGAPFITECPHGRMHIDLESGVFEFVKPGTDIKAAAGEPADLVVTSFTTTALPLVRYRIGDVGILSDETCSCGRMHPVVTQLIGRQEDILFTSERGYVGRLDPVFKQVPPTVEASQILQIEPDTIVVRVVPDPRTFSQDHLDPVIGELRMRLGNVHVIIEIVDDIPRGSNGKFRAVVGMQSPEAQMYRDRGR